MSMLEELEEVEMVVAWKPIETAPVGYSNHVPALIAYEDGSVFFDEEFFREPEHAGKPYQPNQKGFIGTAATHWMPVPEVPFIHPRFRHERDY